MKAKEKSRLGERLEKVRLARGMTKLALSNAVLVSDDSIARWENGKREPSAGMLCALAKILDTSVAYLIGETDDPVIESSSARSKVISFSENESVVENVNMGKMDNAKVDTTITSAKNIIINVGDVHMEFPTGTPSDVIANAIKSAKEA
jgi:transcriptional regulator with XRE-family HTH domain